MFSVAFSNVLLTLLYIVPGFLLCKGKRAVADHLPTLSAVLVYLCSPCMVVSSFLKLDYSLSGLIDMAGFFLVTLVLQALFMLVLFFIFSKKYDDAAYRIVTVGSVLGNVGFFGLPVIKALFPLNPEVMCYSAMYGISMNVLAFTVGVFCLTRKKEYMTPKAAILNPTTFGFVVALVCFIFGLGSVLPPMLIGSIDLLGAMTTPLCMLILGIRLAVVSFGKLFTRPTVYLTTFGKLVAFPLFCYAAVYFLPWFSDVFKASVMVLSATPCASMILNLAEMHRSETELSANSVLVSTLLCFITIPLLVLIL
ncbi:MAG: AEC family transporter [Clostridia bacterium]|nr:AEC family transporter [Clostridia bacterium]